MKKHTLFILLFICFSFPLTAQEKNQDSIGPEIKRGYWLGISPFALIDYSDGSSLRLNLEIPAGKRISVGAEGGFYTGITVGYREKTKGYLIKPFIKYYLNNKEGQLRYIAFEYMYKDIQYRLRDSIDLNDTHYEKLYWVSRTVNTFSVKYGQVSQLKNWLLMEWFVGIGIRYTTSVSTLLEEERKAVLTGYDEETGTDYGESMIKQLSREVGHFTYPNIVAGLKLNIVLKNSG